MLNYKDYEKKVYDWLMAKHQKDNSFTFSVRRNGVGDAKKDYFIGTEKSKYFSTTFWTLPGSYPGSSGDNIGLIFHYTKTGYNYFIEFNQTKSPHNAQNQSILSLLESMKPALEEKIGLQSVTSTDNKMYTLKTKMHKSSYETIEEMLEFVDKDIAIVLPIVNDYIQREKAKNKDFVANRITVPVFESMIDKMEKRFVKYNDDEQKEDFLTFLKKFDDKDVTTYFDFFKYIITTLNLKKGDERLQFSYRGKRLHFTIGQRIAWILNSSEKKGKFYVLSNDKLNESSSQYKGAAPLPWGSYFNELILSEQERQSIVDGFISELNRTKKSGYRTHNDEDFENYTFDYAVGTTSTEIKTENAKPNGFPLNQILYGPPGTGKTFHTINKSLAIIEKKPEEDLKNEDRKEIKKRFDQYVKDGRIVFTTFHQSMSYEDFIEGIKPKVDENEEGEKQVIYDVEKGIFKQLVENAKKPNKAITKTQEVYTFDDGWDDLVTEVNKQIEAKTPLFLSIQTPKLGLQVVDISGGGNLKLKPIYSEQAKEYTVSYSRAKKLQEAFPDLSVIKNIDKEFRAEIGGSNSTAYWSVLNYVNQRIKGNKKSDIQETILPALPYVLVIDEINRGNVSQIFGELITLIEEDKRIGKDEALEVTLPYSNEKFGVPQNVYIIGTMNTADRSVEALDTALRRRFTFKELMPDSKVVAEKGFTDFKRIEIMEKINNRIELLLDRNHTLGHAYFIKDNFKNSFENEIIPLLQEYFYNDYGKIGLVLGKGFVQDKNITKSSDKNIFADFETKNEIDIAKAYELIPFKEVDFEEALQTLLA
ncbi:McrB family protein [Flavobacterium sp. N1994]|uniref:McrB family protein n=1 Tax=Flavobacterium sp. N1994 TaxID=2986827 RepID=UPI002221E052|nr:AAA family ATPase [Flavobacterium sp. N1994]